MPQSNRTLRSVPEGSLNPGQKKGVLFNFLIDQGYPDHVVQKSLEHMRDHRPGSIEHFAKHIKSGKIPPHQILNKLVTNKYVPGLDSLDRNMESNMSGYDPAFDADQGAPHPAFTSPNDPSGSRGGSNSGKKFAPQIKVHSGQSAITCKCIPPKNAESGPGNKILLEFANVAKNKPKINGMNQFDWENKISFCLEPVEAAMFAGVMMGVFPVLIGLAGRNVSKSLIHSPKNGNSSKTLKGELQDGGQVYLEIFAKMGDQKNSVSIPVFASDRIIMASFILSHISREAPFNGMGINDMMTIVARIVNPLAAKVPVNQNRRYNNGDR